MAHAPVDAPATQGEPSLRTAASLDAAAVLAQLDTSDAGLEPHEAGRRLAEIGPNALRTHGTSAWRVLLGQLKNPLLPLLAVAALVSGFTGQASSAVIILVIVAVSVGLGFLNEFRSQKAIVLSVGDVRGSRSTPRPTSRRTRPTSCC